MRREKISNNVIRRLPRYLRKLEELQAHNVERISSGELGRQMGLTPSQIRQDFSCFGEFGQQGYGYNVDILLDAVSTILGLKCNYSIVIVGVGNLGKALIENFGFEEQGFRLTAAFDVDPGLVGLEHYGVRILHTRELHDYVAQNGADVAVLTVPWQLANEVALDIANAGIRAIWNFTNIELDALLPDIVIEDIHFLDSLMALSYYLTDSISNDAVSAEDGNA